jgi:hypothetical protein
MSPKLMLPALLLLLALNGCSKDGTPTDPTGSGGGGGPIGGGTVSGDPVTNGAWPNPDGTVSSPVPVDTTIYVPVDSGGTTGSDGVSTSLLFQTSGSARYNLGTCSANGTWTDPLGNAYGPHNPNCIAYYSDGRVGNNNKGQCVTSPEGYAGLWLNPQGHATSPYHPKCLQLGTPSTVLALNFPVQAELFLANDGSGGSLLNFSAGGTVEAQLVYHGTADGNTTGAGVLVGTDNQVPARTWSIGFSQPALNYTGGFANGDLISDLQSSGVQVVACSVAVGCSLVTLQLSGL